MLPDRIAALAADRTSGASAIVARAIDILRAALAGGADVAATARALVRAQPSMAPVWNAALAALAGPAAFTAFAERVERAPAALVRTALDHFSVTPRHVVTLSFSGSVAAVLAALVRIRPLQVTCSESAPAMEGRALAAQLAAAGVTVNCTADGALDATVAAADAVLVGADAVTAEWFLNKIGTRSLAAAAAVEGTPVYVLASRDKFAGAAVARRLPPSPLFEPTPFLNVRGVVTDGDVLETDAIGRICGTLDRDTPQAVWGILDPQPER